MRNNDVLVFEQCGGRREENCGTTGGATVAPGLRTRSSVFIDDCPPFSGGCLCLTRAHTTVSAAV